VPSLARKLIAARPVHTRRPEAWPVSQKTDAALLDSCDGEERTVNCRNRNPSPETGALSLKRPLERLLRVADSEPPSSACILAPLANRSVRNLPNSALTGFPNPFSKI